MFSRYVLWLDAHVPKAVYAVVGAVGLVVIAVIGTPIAAVVWTVRRLAPRR